VSSPSQWKDVTVSIVFPRALLRRASDPPPTHTFHGEMGGGGFGGDMAVSLKTLSPALLQQTLQRGVSVRVAWTEKGHRRQQMFHFPMKAVKG
jgi:hypothetical protein